MLAQALHQKGTALLSLVKATVQPLVGSALPIGLTDSAQYTEGVQPTMQRREHDCRHTQKQPGQSRTRMLHQIPGDASWGLALLGHLLAVTASASEN